jgi:hypothetical protein
MSKSKITARGLALQLTNDFFKNGCFESVDSGGASAVSPASAPNNQYYNYDDFQSGFAGLSVQCVGCDETEGQEKVFIYVTKGAKKKLEAISSDRSGIPIKIVNIGKTIIKPEAVSSATNRGNVFVRGERIACGSSCQPAGENYSGTFGAIIRRDKDLFALSNNHVFAACNHTPVGQPIMSPSNADTGPNVPAPRVIARHSGIIELRSGNPQLVPTDSLDVAYAAIAPNAVTSWQGNQEDGYDTPTACVSPMAGMPVKKVGKTTGLTFGIVESMVPKFFPLSYRCKKFMATVWFEKIWMVKADRSENFALGGDSGSLVVTEDGKHAVGLLFAVSLGTDEHGYIIPIESILSKLKMSLVSGHGT